ncbi:hypothetical protein EGT07_13330 [Herbaspirillum sp. HC18]|nr:hypothetical protein EGT07_13330 [Herbaspirillum sp. HC18]
MEKVLNAHLSVNGERGYAYLDGNGSRQSGTWQLNDRLYMHKLGEIMRANPDIDVATCTREIVSGAIHSFSFTVGNDNTQQRMHHPPELVQEIVNTLQGGVAQAMEMYREATQGQLPPRSPMPQQHGNSLRRTAHASHAAAPANNTMERPEKRPIYFDGGVEFIGVNHYGRRDLGEWRLEGGKLNGEIYFNTLKNIMDANPGIGDVEKCTTLLVRALSNSFCHKLGNGARQVGFPREAEQSIVNQFKERVAQDMEALRR